MALQEVTAAFLRRFQVGNAPLTNVARLQCRQYATRTDDTGELDQTGFLGSDEKVVDTKAYNPAENARKRNRRLPRSRYQVRPPKYYRGPLHPIQPPKPADPSSRLFKPGPFSLPRLEQTYHDTFEPDFMTLAYTHFPPGTGPHEKGERLRSWVGDSPYFKNRTLRGPRGYEVLPVLRKPITFRNVPRLTGVTVHSMVKEAKTNSSHLHVAGMALQAITGVRATPHAVRHGVAGFEIRPGQHLSVSCNLEGEDMYHFLSKVIDIVMPKIKDFRGIKGSTGDSAGNLAFGLTGEQVALFPEIEVNYDSYPAKMIPGCHIFVKTSAANDRDARVLLSQLGFPFYGKLVN